MLLAPLAEALSSLEGVPIVLDVMSPPFLCAGCGPLKVVRVSPCGDGLAIVAAYRDYERLLPRADARVGGR
ncbi:MAG: hypothetical protein GIW99_01200 [Candidatus Eremiobacteraeota bacterium]|nr:hypothetical protein [Candidatus Eremiobacteraeota bacterium]MBC5826303.1 hypothetical protein [Candidatus Eremiobacteraeota bacterium]